MFDDMDDDLIMISNFYVIAVAIETLTCRSTHTHTHIVSFHKCPVNTYKKLCNNEELVYGLLRAHFQLDVP